MNKYQEALDEYIDAYCEFMYGDREAKNLIKCREQLQELVDRATPKKPKIVSVFLSYISYNCENCDSEIIRSWAGERPMKMPKFCQHCGHEIDWTNQ